MCAFEFVVLIVNIKFGRRPIWCRSMTLYTICGESNFLMIWILRSIKIHLMTIHTIAWSAFVSIDMTFGTINSKMRSCQRKSCSIVIKRHIGITLWMTSKTSIIAISIAYNIFMCIICLRIEMTTDTSKF